MTPVRTYGREPRKVSFFPMPQWQEFMSYLYLPVIMPGIIEDRIPERLQFAKPLVWASCQDFVQTHPERDPRKQHVYITAKRGYAVPGHALNRPGWHTDGFGSDDVNYVWCDAFPTVVAAQDFGEISDDHILSVEQFEDRIRSQFVYEIKPNTLYRFDPFVVHAAPEIPAPGGMRSFLKVSISEHKYNLVGNSRNYLFDYDWKMHERADVRNDPHYAGGDFYEDDE